MPNFIIKAQKKIFTTDERSSRMRKNTIIMMGIKGLSIFLSLITASVMLRHVNRVDYGVLLTLTSIVNWVSMMDIGIGNGLRNKLPEYLANKNYNKAKTIISSCYFVLLLYISILITIFIITSPFLNWLDILNAPQSNGDEIRKLANVVFIAFCLNFLFGLINSILFACQMPALQSFFSFLGQLLSFTALLIQVYVFKINSVFQIGSINCLIPPLVLLVGSIYIFLVKLKRISPSYKFLDIKSVGNILSLGIKFFILQIITIVLFQANSIIITKAVGPEAVVEYNLAFKYISVLVIAFNIIITPIWSATTDAYVKKDFTWIKKTIAYTRKICFATIIMGIIMVILSPFVYNIWLGKETIHINYLTTFLVLVYLSFEMLYKVYGTIINGIGKVYAQIIITGIIAICYLPIAYNLGTHWGLPGVLLANCIIFLLNYVWSRIQCLKLINKTATGIWNK